MTIFAIVEWDASAVVIVIAALGAMVVQIITAWRTSSVVAATHAKVETIEHQTDGMNAALRSRPSRSRVGRTPKRQRRTSRDARCARAAPSAVDRYGEVEPVTETELIAALTYTDVVALTIFGEARGAGVEGMRAVGDVIRNRVMATHYGGWREVCLRKWQFSCWTPVGGPSNYLTVISAAKAIVFKTARPQLLELCVTLAIETVDGVRPDSTLGSTHYLVESLYLDPLKCPAWARRLTPAVQIGSHVFFNSVA